MAPTKIPFNRPTLEGYELEYIRQAVGSGHTSSGGSFTERVRALLRDELDAADVLLTTSCTDALEMAALLLELGPQDTVIVPSFTFVSTAVAFARTGARIKFADIETSTLGIDPAHVAQLLDPTVRAVVPVHYAGVGCEIDSLNEVLGHRDIDIVEDNAHGLFAEHEGRKLGSFGRFSTLSFHETKNFVSGEGGALVVNDPADVDRAHVLLDKGTNRRAFMLGDVDKYSWKDIGSSFGQSDILAAYLWGQLEQREQILAKRAHVFDRYEATLGPHADELGFRTPHVPEGRTCAYHMFYTLLPDRGTRDHVLKSLRAAEIYGTFHYVPLHSSDGGRRFAAHASECPETEDVSGRLLRLPFHNALTDADVDRVCDEFLAALRS